VIEFRAICTAVVVPGEITQRIDRVIRPTSEARAMIARAAQIWRKSDRARRGQERQRRMSAKRLAADLRIAAKATRRRREPHHNSTEARPFQIISISIYQDTLAQLDAAVRRFREAGILTMSRSELLRIGFAGLDVDAAIAAEAAGAM